MSEYESISALIAITSFGISIFLAFILSISPSRYYTNVYLGLVMIIGSAVFMLRYLVVTKSTLAIYAPLIVFPSMFLFGPILFFYTRAILFGAIASRKEFFQYSIPSIIVFILFIFLICYYPEFRDMQSITKQQNKVGIFTAFSLLSAMLYIFYFCVLSVKYVFIYERELENEYSKNEKGRLVWLKAFIGINILNVITYFFLTLFFFLGILTIPPVTPIESIINLGMVYLILYYLVRKPEIISVQFLEEILPTIPNDLKEKKAETKYSKQSLTAEERKHILGKIKDQMSVMKPYLDEGISLKEISENIGIPAHHISMTINIELTQNFFQFINSYRIAEARLLLENPNLKSSNVLNLGLQSGFQSKAAFNKAFKSSTGMTPTEYRNKFLS